VIKNRILNIGCSTDMDIGSNLTKMGYNDLWGTSDLLQQPCHILAEIIHCADAFIVFIHFPYSSSKTHVPIT
jgi:hypothetical protein